MSSEAQNLMIEVIDAHTYNGADRGVLGEHRVEYCICGWSEEGDGVHTAHVASEVDKALGQRPQPDSLPTGRRYLMSDVVERAKATLEGVTEGPWTFQHWGGQNQNGDYAESILFDGAGESMTYGLPDRDGEFIAQARTLVPELVAEVEELRLVVAAAAVALRGETR
ncbi:hypothetical protein I5H76_gp078 [Mycobacterium phage Phasih]|uniref:Uncharacterized protein n=1 Tax=Mycobacterium phage Phasih TaxID=2041544 RepID=A0A2D1GHK4_9CAUD|nr:hypothetical protein I5H76_gp078 [Mycobacterium phage Phasih]ATN91256.1 hypothetical protein SEA_PHASIH_78 [Mycobacterium phage Phasih]